ncbi:uncharacterized protein LOC132867998 isoform X2 [Neoarius graeffei]|uniref:uncharacterized protein LOC132867998 isoform X2 n=1 Tax=Neoarius graeffei TaxID=443677 RepID=UPI00298C135B|nr:uncharacterized protein LOC132867998 isoform X2 [Neoarius graeffei]
MREENQTEKMQRQTKWRQRKLRQYQKASDAIHTSGLKFQSQTPHFNPLFYPILPPQSHPPSYFIMPDQFYPPSHPVLRSASYYPPPAMMGMNEHHVPSVQEILGGNAASPVTPPEGGRVDDGCVITAQAHATDVLTLEPPASAESEPEPQPTYSLPPETVGIEESLSSRPPSPNALMWGEIMDSVDPIPSRPPTPTLLPWGDLMEERGFQKDKGQVDDFMEVKEKVEEKEKGAVIRELKKKVKQFQEPKKQADANTNKLPSSASENTKFQSETPHFNPLFYPILPPQSHPPSYFIMPDQFYPPSHPILRSASYYPPPAMMGMNEHHVPSDQEILGGNTASPVTPPEGGRVDDGCVITAQAHATDMLTLDQHVAPEPPASAESEPEPQPTYSLPPETVGIEEPLSSRPPSPKALKWGEIMDSVDPIPSRPPTPTLLPWGENLAVEGSELSLSPNLSSLSWGEIMDNVNPIPSRPPTPTLLPWGDLMEEMGFQKDEEQMDDILEVKEKVEEKEKGAVIRELKKKVKQFQEPKEQADANTNKLPSSASENTKGVELYIRGIDSSVDSRRLLNEFHPFGKIIKAKVVMENGSSRGFGYITYQTMTEATTAIREMNRKMLGWKPLFVALSRSKDERQSCSGPREQKTRSGLLFEPWPSHNPDKQRVQSQSGSQSYL